MKSYALSTVSIKPTVFSVLRIGVLCCFKHYYCNTKPLKLTQNAPMRNTECWKCSVEYAQYMSTVELARCSEILMNYLIARD